VDGVLLLDKPLGFSSQQALSHVKRLLCAEKGGHTGTLDPLATGLLPLCFGEATKFAQGLVTHITELINQGTFVTIEQLEDQWQDLLAKFQKITKGPAKLVVLNTMLGTKPLETARKVATLMIKREKEESQKKVKEAQEKAQKEYARLEELYKDVDSEWKRAQDQNKELSAEKKDLGDRLNKAERTVRDLQDTADRLERKLRDVGSDKLQLEEENKRLKDQLTDKETKAKGLEDQAGKEARERERLQREIDEMSKRKCAVM